MVLRFPETLDAAVLLTDGVHGFDVMIEVGILLFPETAFAGYLASGRW